ncbi:MAG TPA: ECF-type sigma factor [Candidatus Thermoplasmatota archaeon]
MSEDHPELEDLFSHAYEELRRLASVVRQGDPSATLTPTCLVHEAWLRLARSPGLEFSSELHFKRIAARAMRRVLVEAARARHAAKRGGGKAMVAFDDALGVGAGAPAEVLALDQALDKLARLEPRQAAMIEGRFFGGLDVRETAELLQVSEATILRDWRAARAWLAVELQQP